MSLKVGFA